MKVWNIGALTGYKPKTTFYEDFSIAEEFGENAVVDTYKRAFDEWKSNTEYLTELVMVLNWKIWEHYTHSRVYEELYSQLYEIADRWAVSHLKGDDLIYYYTTTD